MKNVEFHFGESESNGTLTEAIAAVRMAKGGMEQLFHRSGETRGHYCRVGSGFRNGQIKTGSANPK